MSYQDEMYHSQRAEQCRVQAELANDPDVRRRHEELAELHSRRAENTGDVSDSSVN